MEQENAALVQGIYDAFARGDAQYILSKLTDDVEWTIEAPAAIPYSGKRRGKAAVAEFFVAIASTEDGPRLTTSDIVASGGNVAAFGRYSATVKTGGRKIRALRRN